MPLQRRAQAWALRLLPWLPYILVAGTVMIPLLGPGFIFAPDMTFAPKLPMPDAVTPSYPFFALLHGVNFLIPATVIQKLILCTALVLPGIGMHRLTRLWHLPSVNTTEWQWACYVSGLVYMVNPFVYSRLMTGQYLVLLGYGLLPFAVSALWRYASGPGRDTGVRLCLLILALSALSLHTLGIFAVVMVAVLLSKGYQRRQQEAWLRQLIKTTALLVVAVLGASSYWLVPALAGSGSTAQIVSNFGAADISAFAVQGDGLGRLGNVLGLQGFWADARNLYLMPGDIFSGWIAPLILLWLLVLAGVVWLWRVHRPLVLLLGTLAVLGICLALSTSIDSLSPLIAKATAAVPFVAAYREPQKFLMLTALAYGYFAGVGAIVIREQLRTRTLGQYIHTVTLILLLVPLATAPLLLWGCYGQFTPRSYPADWYAANNYLNTRLQPGETVLFLPWHLYMRFSFTDGITSNPADKFFDAPVIISDKADYRGAASYFTSTEQKILSNSVLPRASSTQNLSLQLRQLHIRYVILSKNFDYKAYAYLDRQSGIAKTYDSKTLRIYSVK